MAQHETGETSGPTNKPRIVESPHVGLPEFLRRETVEGLLPHTVTYLTSDTLTYDEYTGKIWLNTNASVREANFALESYVQSKNFFIAIMPVLGSDGAKKYVLDASGMRSGQLGIEEDWLGYKEEAEYDDVSDFMKKKRLNSATIAAAAFTNLEGETEFHGEAQYFDALRYLVDIYDAHMKENIEIQNSKYSSMQFLDKDPSLDETTDDSEAENETEIHPQAEAEAPSTSSNEPKIELIYRLPDDPLL